MSENLVLLERAGHVAEIVLNRPATLNAINSELAQELLTIVTAVAADADVWVVILRGAGERAFSAGADLVERNSYSAAQWQENRRLLRAMFGELRHLPQPIIAAVRGFALGGGAELVLLCDCVIAASDAVFGFPEARLGIVPGGNGVLNLPRLLGPNRAKELLFTGRRLSALEAHGLGIVQGVVEPATLLDDARAFAGSLLESAPLSLRAIKEVANAALDLPWSDALDAENVAYQRVVSSNDRAEGIRAFNEKRSPSWSGS